MEKYKNWTTVATDLRKVILAKHGFFPKAKELKTLNKELYDGIIKFHGGINAVREKIGYLQMSLEYWKNPVYWENPENSEREMNEAIRKNNGKFPTPRDLIKAGHSALVVGIQKYHGGLSEVRKKMGFKQVRKPIGHYENWENVKRELEKIIDKTGKSFPKATPLTRIGNYVYKPLSKISCKLRKEAYDRRPVENFKEWENLEPEIEFAVALNNRKHPTQKFFEEIGLGRVLEAIQKYHGGMSAVRKKISSA